MNSRPHADVIIAGGGPAGSLAAYELATKGISVLLFEKAVFPRYKVCGAGLTHKILNEIPFSVDPVLETSIHSVRFSCGYGEVFTRTSDQPLMYCTMRADLDRYLLEQAGQAGADLRYGIRVTGFTQDQSGVVVETTAGSFQARLLIGAEGASGTIARAAGLRDHLMQGLAWEAELKPRQDFLTQYGQTVFLDWGTFPGGYGWIFPKRNHISVGVGGPASLSAAMMPYYHRFLDSAGITTAETISLKSWPIPVRVRRTAFHRCHVMVTGDAAGLTDPLTGEGIYYAVRSGKLAAEAAIGYLSGRTDSLQSYSVAVNEDLMGDLTEANRIKALFNTVPKTIHRWVGTSDRAWRAFGKVLRGERNYADVRRGFGKWKFLWGVACGLAGMISVYKENRFPGRSSNREGRAVRKQGSSG